MKIKFLFVGKKNSQLLGIANDYLAKINRSCQAEIQILSPSGLSSQDARRKESAQILSKISSTEVVWLLDEAGQQVDSPALAKKIKIAKEGNQNLCIVVGGAFGVSVVLKKKADYNLSLSKMVFPHEVAWLVVTEQIYRAFEIIKGSSYHHQ